MKWNAKDYSTHSQAQQSWADGLIEKLDLKETKSLLDIGCGDGRNTAKIAKMLHGGAALGIDSSPDMVALAKERFNSRENLSFEIHDAASMPFQEKFDLAFSNSALHWMLDQRTVFKRTFQALRKGGRFAFQMGGDGNMRLLLKAAAAVSSRPEWRRFMSGFKFPWHFPSLSECRASLEDAGFTILRIEAFPKEVAGKDAEELAGWLRPLWMAWTDLLPAEEAKERLLRDTALEYLKSAPQSNDGRFLISMERIEAEAAKS